MAVVRQHHVVDIFTLRNAVAMDVQHTVDVCCFAFGAGLGVELQCARADDGSWQYFDAFIPALKGMGTVEIPNSLLLAVSRDTQAQIALGDFREAMRVPVQTGFFCFRAVEAIMQAFRSGDDTTKVGWDRMRAELGVSRAKIDIIKVHADWARHGQTGQITDSERRDLLLETKAIIQRYLDYSLRRLRPPE
jgi:hypothetical protein